ncbi:MAG: LysE family transporter [Alphaproteobacteria bacterium]
MIEFAVLLKIVPVFILALISPGPDFMIVSSMSLARGGAEGIKAAAGISTVIMFYALISLTGLSALFAHYLWVAVALRVCGGCYLLYLGFMMWRGSFSARALIKSPAVNMKKKSAYKAGVLTCLTNPKAIAFFASLFAIALTPDTHFATKAALEIIAPLFTFLWFSFVALGLSKPSVRTRYQRWQHIIDRLTGTVLAFFGVKLILSVRG